MSTNIAKIDANTAISAMSEQEVMAVLKSSLYPGAADDSVKMVLAYCQATKLDPMQKPVHIVPIWDGKAGKMRDVVMPGIGLYRTQAARSGQYAGVSEPEYGQDVTETLDGIQITYPSWCKVTIKRKMEDGDIAEFTAVERWKENYAMKGGKERSIAPNAMWYKRPYGQLAKCAEAQALRKAFPEIGAQPTADEMEGKELERPVDPVSNAPTQKQLPVYPTDKFDANLPLWLDLIQSGEKTAEAIIATVSSKYILTKEQQEKLKADVVPTEQVEVDAAWVSELEGAE